MEIRLNINDNLNTESRYKMKPLLDGENVMIKQFMETVNYRITEGSDYGWQCYGHNAYMLDSWNGEQDGHSLSIIFDTKTQEVYEVQAHDYVNERAYRWINPDYVKKNNKEARKRDVNRKEAWDNVDYVDLETVDDFFEKAQAIVQGQPYDTRVQVPIDLPDHEWFQLMKMAHDRDITLNQMVEDLLKKCIDQV
jgi:hypothetical protein